MGQIDLLEESSTEPNSRNIDSRVRLSLDLVWFGFMIYQPL